MPCLNASSMLMCSIFVNSKVFPNVYTAKAGDFLTQ